jgi:hypothetical protein
MRGGMLTTFDNIAYNVAYDIIYLRLYNIIYHKKRNRITISRDIIYCVMIIIEQYSYILNI